MPTFSLPTPFAMMLLCLSLPSFAIGADPEFTNQLRALDSRVIVLGTVRRAPLESMLAADVDAKLREANRADRRAWEKVTSRADWEPFRETRIQALRQSLGMPTQVPDDLKLRVTGTIAGEGYHIDKLAFVSRPGEVVVANLYRPAKPAESMPGIIICHSHQSTKHSSWRQDMAMTWARAGCVVLVPDHLGHGERRQHPFGEDGQHDYHFRYDLATQLHLIGESLMGRLTWDLMRGVDVLMKQKGVDAKRIVMISEPAGGGDVAAVTAALDSRITCVMVQNFGGPQPETMYPLPRDADESFEYTGRGSWESTRNLRLSARDGFLPWTIVASVAPRKLIYYHEFYWDRDNDPVWKRLQRIYDFYQARDSLTGLAGRGFVVGSAPENSHWLPGSRALLYPIMEKWFSIPNPKTEYSKRQPVESLLCLTPEAKRELKPQPLHEQAQQLATQQLGRARTARLKLKPEEQRIQMRQEWATLLGDVAPPKAILKSATPEAQSVGKATVERTQLGTDSGIVVPLLLFLPPRAMDQRAPVVVAVAQQGKEAFLRQQADTIAELLSAGIAVALPDLRGTGETAPGEARDRRSSATAISASEWMVGQSLLGGRLRDLRSILVYLRSRSELDSKRIALWGDSFAKVNPSETNFQVPYTAAARPQLCEPLGGQLALLGSLFEDEIRAVVVHRGLSDFHSVFESPFCYLPHDGVVPGVLKVGDVTDLAATLSPTPLWLNEMVDSRNRVLSDQELTRRFELTRIAYSAYRFPPLLRLGQPDKGKETIDGWLRMQLK